MGRFYETEKSRFVDDFIYKPNYNLMNAVLEKEQTGFNKVNADNADLLNQLKFKYIEESNADRANAEAIRAKYAKDVDVVTNQIRDTSKDWRTARPQIDNLKKELAQDFATGDISKLQKSRDAYDKWKTELNAKVKDADTKTAAEKYWFDKWNKESPTGSVNKLFGADETYDKIDVQKIVNDEIKLYNIPEMVEKSFANPEGEYIRKGSQSRKERTLDVTRKLFENIVRSKKLEPYLQQREILPLGLQEKYYGDDKKLMSFSDKNSSMYNASEAAAELARVLEIGSKSDLDVSSLALQQRKINADKDAIAAAKAANDKKIKDSMTIAIKQKTHFTKTASGKNQVIEMKKQLFGLLPPSSINDSEEKKIATIEDLKINGSDAQKEKIRDIELKKNKDQVSGYTNVQEYYGVDIAESVRNRFGDPDVINKVKTSKVLFDFGENPKFQNYAKGVSKDPNAGLTMGEYEKILAKNKGGNSVDTGQNHEGRPFFPSKIEYIDNSAAPMFTYDDGKDGLGGSAGYVMVQEEIKDPETGKITRPRVEVEITGTIPTHLVDINTDDYSKVAPEKRVTSINRKDE